LKVESKGQYTRVGGKVVVAVVVAIMKMIFLMLGR
jgi:hypothetical protein